MTHSAYVIAEAGNNHNGKLETALKLIDAAKESAADSVKFQIIYPEGLYVPEFVRDGIREKNPILEIRRKAMLTDDEYGEIKKYCDNQGIAFSASVFDERGIRLLCDLNVSYIKIASTDLNNTRLLRQAAETKKKLIVSTGMSTLSEVDQAVKVVTRAGNDDIVLLHCVSVYPAATRIMNLCFIDVLKMAFGLPVGLSDHSESSLAVAVALAKGITFVEKHFTLDRRQEGYDHAYAMEPGQLKQYIQDIRDVEEACRRPKMKITELEQDVMNRARRGIYFAHDVEAGAEIRPEDVMVVRPPTTFRADEIDRVVGKRLKRDRKRFEPIRPDDFH